MSVRQGARSLAAGRGGAVAVAGGRVQALSESVEDLDAVASALAGKR